MRIAVSFLVIPVFQHTHRVQFRDTDAAGVVYFANVLAICHDAYEASLAEVGIELKTFFHHPTVAVPIVHSSVDFYKPMYCGDRLSIHLTPTLLTPESFEVAYQIYAEAGSDRPISQALTRHVCIDPQTRRKIPLPDVLSLWVTHNG